MKETRNKRKSQYCKCFKFKIDKSNLSKMQSNQLRIQFVDRYTCRVLNIINLIGLNRPNKYKMACKDCI